MLSKTTLASGMLVATAAGVVMTSAPSFAQVLTWGGGCGSSCGGCSTSSCSSFGHFNRNRSWNGNENEGFNHIRLRIRNRNNNVAVARTRQDDERPLIVERQREREK
ncbi:hypothetical protein [Actinoallomurus sp. CA-142502]|uniref:hypothetical protein n=1 Tax=Actinoallomurus sp. CA-142502 TaxID=3239885 RepID=UPI003D8ED22B